MDTKEAQEFGKEIVAKATQRELKKQEYIRYQQRRPQAVEYDFPKPGTIPVPQLEKSREKREARPQSVLSNFEVPIMKKYPCTVEIFNNVKVSSNHTTTR